MAKLIQFLSLAAVLFTLSHVTLSEVGQYITAVLDFLFSSFQLYLVLMPTDGGLCFPIRLSVRQAWAVLMLARLSSHYCLKTSRSF